MSIFVMFGGLAWFGWAVLSAEEYSVSEYANMPSIRNGMVEGRENCTKYRVW